MGSNTSKPEPGTELDFQVGNCRALRDSLKALQKSLSASNQTLSTVPGRIMDVADGFTQTTTCASHGTPGVIVSHAGAPHSAMTADGRAPSNTMPDLTPTVEMAADMKLSMSHCEREQSPQYSLTVEREVIAQVGDLIALATRSLQDGKTAVIAYNKFAAARRKVESVEESAKEKGKDVNEMKKYTQACTARGTAEANWQSYGQAFQASYQTLLKDVADKTPKLMQQYASLTVIYQRDISAGIESAAASQQASLRPATAGGLGDVQQTNVSHASLVTGGVIVNQVDVNGTVPASQPLSSVTVSPYTNPSGPSTRGPSAQPPDSPLSPMQPPGPQHVKPDPPLPTPRSQQRPSDDSPVNPEEPHEPLSTIPRTQANRSSRASAM